MQQTQARRSVRKAMSVPPAADRAREGATAPNIANQRSIAEWATPSARPASGAGLPEQDRGGTSDGTLRNATLPAPASDRVSSDDSDESDSDETSSESDAGASEAVVASPRESRASTPVMTTQRDDVATTRLTRPIPSPIATRRLVSRIRHKMGNGWEIGDQEKNHAAHWIVYETWDLFREHVDESGEGEIPHLTKLVTDFMTHHYGPRQRTAAEAPVTMAAEPTRQSTAPTTLLQAPVQRARPQGQPAQPTPQPQPPQPQPRPANAATPDHRHEQVQQQSHPHVHASRRDGGQAGAQAGGAARNTTTAPRATRTGGSWQKTSDRIQLDISFHQYDRLGGSAKGVRQSIEEWASTPEVNLHDSHVKLRHFGKTLRVTLSGIPTGKAWTSVSTCILHDHQWLQTGSVVARVPGRHDPLSACIIDTTATQLNTREKLRQKLDDALRSELYRLDPIGRMGNQGAGDRNKDASPIWLLTLRKPESDFINILTTTLAPRLATVGLKVQAPFKSGRALLHREGKWKLSHLTDIPRLTLSTGPPISAGDDISRQLVAGLIAEGIPEPAEVWWMGTGRRAIVRATFLERDHLRKAATRLSQGAVHIGRRSFVLAPDLQILEKSLHERGLCPKCGGSATSGTHGFRKCYGTARGREPTCWSCGERRSNHTDGVCPHGPKLIRSTLDLLLGPTPTDTTTNQWVNGPPREPSAPSPPDVEQAMTQQQAVTAPTRVVTHTAGPQPTSEARSTSTALSLLKSAMGLLRMAVDLESKARASGREEDRAAAEWAAQSLERLVHTMEAAEPPRRL